MPFSRTAYPLPSLLPQGANQNRFVSQGKGHGGQSGTEPRICPHSRPYLSNSQSSKAPSPLPSSDFIPADLIGKTTSPQLALDSLWFREFPSPSLGDSILQARLQQHVNRELRDIQAGFRKGRGTRDQIANIHRIMEKARVPEKYLFLLY